MQRSLAQFFFTFVIDTIFVFISCVNCIFVFDQLRTVGWFLFVFNHESNVKDNLCRSELIKVRLFDENFFRFLREIIPLWCLDNELRCCGEENAWFISYAINCCVSQIFWVFLCILCYADYDCVSAACSLNNSDPSWAGQKTQCVSTVPLTAHYTLIQPTSIAGTSINYVQSSFYIQACSWIYIRNYWAMENEFCRDFFPF